MTGGTTDTRVAALARDADAVAVALNAAGLEALRSRGRAALLAELAATLQVPASANWRLLAAEADPTAPASVLGSARPQHPRLLDAQQDGDDQWQLRLYLDVDLTGFDGHFSTLPVVPGVLQLGWALQLAAPRLQLTAQCREIEALKFQRLLRPGEHVQLSLRVDRERGKLYFAYRVGASHASSGRLRVEPAHG